MLARIGTIGGAFTTQVESAQSATYGVRLGSAYAWHAVTPPPRSAGRI
jgi:hypothetical protein